MNIDSLLNCFVQIRNMQNDFWPYCNPPIQKNLPLKIHGGIYLDEIRYYDKEKIQKKVPVLILIDTLGNVYFTYFYNIKKISHANILPI
jgi:hypothetical protein